MKNKISNDEARTALAGLEVIEQKSRHMAFADFAAFPLMMWGVLWCFQYLLGYSYTLCRFQLFGLHPDRLAGWLTLVGLGATLVFSVFKLRFANPIRSSGTWFERYRAPLLTLVWFLFHFTTQHLHTFESGRAMNAFYVAYWMLLFVVYGFWFAHGLFIVVAAVIGISAMVGYFAMGDHYALWMAIMGGGTLFAGGLYAKLKCRVSARDSES